MVRDSPRSAGAHDLEGRYHSSQHDLPRALDEFRTAHTLRPQSGEILLHLGATESALGQTDSALVHIGALTRLEPDYAPGWYSLGTLALRAGRADEARGAFEQVLRLTPDDARAENNLGAALEELGRTDEALRHYRRALEIRPDYRDALENLRRFGR